MKPILLLFFSAYLSAAAQDGKIDSTYGTNGRAYSNFTEMVFADPYQVAIQSDNKIIKAGSIYSASAGISLLGVLRFNANGTVDNTFGTNGRAMIPFGFDYMGPSAIAIQSDGKIVVAGTVDKGPDTDIAVVRLNANGTLDASFGSAGKVLSNASGNDYARAIKIQADLKILVAGNGQIAGTFHSNMLIMRYNSNGNLDATFGNNGEANLAIGSYSSGAHSIAVQSDGKILLGGFTTWLQNFSLYPSFAVARFNVNGTLDATFGSNGSVVPSVFIYGQISGIAVQPDGKIVTAGGASASATNNAQDIRFGIVRLNANGTSDAAFGTNGGTLSNIGSENSVWGIGVQTDGKILVSGHYKTANDDFNYAIVRYTSAGTLDNTFGTNGITTIGMTDGSDDKFATIAGQGNNIILAGFSSSSQVRQFSTVRLNNSASFYTPPHTPVSINNPAFDIKFVIAPNPVRNTLMINYTGILARLHVTIYDITGKLMTMGNFTSTYSINTRSFTPGTYVVNIINKKTGDQVRRMIVKQ
jgi:uncharacterized delta-60 repeat protein